MYTNYGSLFTDPAYAREYESYFLDPSRDVLKYAFKSKMSVRPLAGREQIPPEQIPAKYPALLESLTGSTGIYIHVPFCKTKCLYCGFAGETPNDTLSRAYIKALIKEAEYLSGFAAVRNAPVRVIYFGGGTPSALPPDALAELLATLRNKFNLANDCEITLEARVSDMDKARQFIDCGFSRFSLGVQSFNTKIRRLVGRLNTQEETLDLLERLIKLDRAAVIIDLIYGLPNQSTDDFIEDLKTARELGVDGLDTYQLSVFPSSKLAQAIEAGKIMPAADSTQLGAYYVAANEYLLGRHTRQLSNNHYAFTNRERNIYNSWVKSGNSFIALGAGAGGSINGFSSYRTPVASKYIEQAEQDLFVPEMLTLPSLNRDLQALVAEQMERGFLYYEELCVKANLEPECMQKVLHNWAQCGLVALDSGRLELTPAGKFWYVNLMQAVNNILYMQQ